MVLATKVWPLVVGKAILKTKKKITIRIGLHEVNRYCMNDVYKLTKVASTISELKRYSDNQSNGQVYQHE